MKNKITNNLTKINILNKEQINKTMILLKRNFNHLLIFKMLLGLGITVKELINLKIKDIDIIENKIKIYKRNYLYRSMYIPLPILADLRTLICHRNQEEFLLKGRGEKIHERTVQKILKEASKKQGYKLSPKILKNTLLFFLIEANWSVQEIINFFGLSSKRTTLTLLKEMEQPILKARSNVFDTLFQIHNNLKI